MAHCGIAPAVVLGIAIMQGASSFKQGDRGSCDSGWVAGKPTSVPVLNNEVVDGEINFDDANNTRLQDYLRIDMSAIYKFKLIHGLNSKIGASLWNVLNRENAINDYYRIGLDNSPNQFTRFALGTTLNVMVRLNF